MKGQPRQIPDPNVLKSAIGLRASKGGAVAVGLTVDEGEPRAGADHRGIARQSCWLDHRPPRVQSRLCGSCGGRGGPGRSRGASLCLPPMRDRFCRVRREDAPRSRGGDAPHLDGGDRCAPEDAGCDRRKAVAKGAEAGLSGRVGRDCGRALMPRRQTDASLLNPPAV